MADETKQPQKASGPKKIRRIQIGFNVLAQIVLILFLTVAINSIAFKHYQRWDFSRDQKYALSDKTKRFLKGIKGKMRITFFFSPNTPITADVQNLLTEYQYAGKAKIDIEHVDPERNFSRAKELFDKYKVVTDESLLVLDYEGRNKTVKASEMADIDQSEMAFGEGPRVTAFKGEQAITSAMMDLVEGKKNTLGYVVGHKEPPLSENSAISILKTFIENENIRFQELNLFNLDAIPSELKTILIVGPQYDLSDREMKLLRDFWDKQGRILLLLDPSAKTPRLDGFLKELGVKVNDDRLMVFLRTGIEEVALTRDVQAHFLGGSPITKRLVDVRALFFGGTSSLTLEPDRVRTANIRIDPLIQAEKGYFAETDYNTDDQTKLQVDAKRNSNTTLTVGAAVEKGASADERVQVNSARLVVVSNAAFVQDNAITQDQQALDFISGSVNWLLSPLRSLRWIILVFMPLIPAVIGAVVWWQRRV
ncbi:MAG: hypothetical protein DME62_07180 [Verrucomicrobia bacterium]|nr:MAG: hypothetical protein DME62_07180 [Verrucomicrobiota bacterium]